MTEKQAIWLSMNMWHWLWFNFNKPKEYYPRYIKDGVDESYYSCFICDLFMDSVNSCPNCVLKSCGVDSDYSNWEHDKNPKQAARNIYEKLRDRYEELSKNGVE